MKNLKKILALLMTLTTVLALCAGCKKDAVDPGVEGEAGTYTVTVTSAGGLPLEGVSVYIYGDTDLDDMKEYGTTDANGKVSLELQAGHHYISLGTVPKGYTVEKYYNFDGTSANIVLTSALVSEDDISTATLGLGDIMYDFTVTKPDGTEVKLSEVLSTKKAVVLNFWYTTCTWCIQEFPVMQQAYDSYQEDIGIIALDPMDNSTAVDAFQKEQGLSFDMASCPASWANVFGIEGYPTTVIVDRYGMICMVEGGALTTLRYWTDIFEHFTSDSYTQKLLNSAEDLVTRVKPNVSMPSQEELTQILGSEDMTVTYRADDDDEYAWPFVQAEKNGQVCLKAPNSEIDGSYAMLFADITLEKGQAVGFDYFRSSEANADILHVLVNGEAIYSISGINETDQWETCYPIVADQDGVYELLICYIKDDDTAEGEDTFYIKNLHLANVKDIDVPTYLPRKAALTEDGFTYTYASIVYSTKDGYYHVDTADGPLLLVDMMGTTDFNEEQSLWDMVNGETVEVNGKDYTQLLTDYANYSSNSNLNGICPVTQELYEALVALDQLTGFDEADTKEWMKACKYFQAYGTGGEQLEDPVKGLAPFSAYTAKLGKNVATNYFTYNRIIMPRGLLAEFVPSKSGVYRITSRTDSTNGVEGWIFDGERNELLVYEPDERMFEDSEELSMVFYMEKGKSYYIDIAFWDPYEEGTIYYDIEYIAASYDHFRLCSQGYFTYDTDATGSAMYDVIAGGIKVTLGSDGIYYQDLGDGKTGSKIYADFTGITGIFDTPIATTGDVMGLIDKGAFDFSKTENDQYVLTALSVNGGDKDKTIEYLKSQWGADYDANYEDYQVKDVFAGIYHGEGEDYTETMKSYLGKMINDGHAERKGCVAVTQELAEILQLLMDKFTFEDVDNSWIKLCYYYDHLG